MLIFMVVTRFTNGRREERAFASSHAARAHAARQAGIGDTEVLEIPVIGELEQANLAFTILWNDHTPDTHNIEGIYGSHRLARMAVGDLGYVREIEIDTGNPAITGQCGADGRPGVIDFYQSAAWTVRDKAQRQRAMRELRAKRLLHSR